MKEMALYKVVFVTDNDKELQLFFVIPINKDNAMQWVTALDIAFTGLVINREIWAPLKSLEYVGIVDMFQ